MKVGVLGTGDVGKALGRGFLTLGNEVMLGSREANHPNATAWVKEMGAKTSTGTFAETAKFADVVVLATLGIATENALRMAGPENFRGKLVLDSTNPLDFSKGMPPRLVGGVGDSQGEKNQKLLAGANVVKAFNTVGNAFFFRPLFPGGAPDMFICGSDESAKKKTAAICKDFGWGIVDVGGIDCSHYLEAMCMVWVLSAMKTGNWNQAFKMLRK